jgi:membrane-associated protease RseP (regulator of RpoE activity)
VGIGRAAGQAATAEPATGGVQPSFTDRLLSLLSLIASLNVALFVFNLIPLLPLDGGHVAGALWEGLRRRIAQWRHRPDPGPVDIARALPLAYGVVSLLIGMSVLLVYADIVNPVTFG